MRLWWTINENAANGSMTIVPRAADDPVAGRHVIRACAARRWAQRFFEKILLSRSVISVTSSSRK